MTHRTTAVLGIALAGLVLGAGAASASTPSPSPIELPGGVTVESMTWPTGDDGWVLAATGHESCSAPAIGARAGRRPTGPT